MCSDQAIGRTKGGLSTKIMPRLMLWETRRGFISPADRPRPRVNRSNMPPPTYARISFTPFSPATRASVAMPRNSPCSTTPTIPRIAAAVFCGSSIRPHAQSRM